MDTIFKNTCHKDNDKDTQLVDDVWDMNYGRTSDNNINDNNKPNVQVVNLLGLDSKDNKKDPDIEWNKLCNVYEVTTSQKKALTNTNTNTNTNIAKIDNNTTNIANNVINANVKTKKKKKKNNKPELNKKCVGCDCNNDEEYDNYDDTYDSYYND